MKAAEIEEKVVRIAEPIAVDMGLELADVIYTVEGGGLVLRVLIDSAKGIGVEDCSRLSRALSAALDVEDFIANSYSLEVSSPGLDRPLRKEKDFQKFIGRKIRLKTRAAVDGRRNFKAVLESVTPGVGVKLKDSEGRLYDVDFKNIDKARLEIEL